MRIAVNGCFVLPGRVGGAEHMFYNLLDGLRGHVRPDEDWQVLTREPLDTAVDLAPLHEVRLAGLSQLNRTLFEPVAAVRLRGVDASYNPNYYSPPGQRGRVVTTIHDAQYAHFPENFSAVKRRWLALAHATTFRLADVVVAISRSVADDLLRLHGARYAGKLEVVSNPVSFSRFVGGELPAEVDPQRPAVLCAAAAYKHKNLQTLLQAFSTVAQKSDAVLLLTGASRDQLVGTSSATDLSGMVDELGLGDRVRFLGYVSEQTLGALYRHASVFCLPSLFEGFGMPVVEALGVGTPTVTTRSCSLPEVSLGLARYVTDPRDPAELADVLLEVLDDPDEHRPSLQEQSTVRETYAPQTIGGRYADLIRG